MGLTYTFTRKPALSVAIKPNEGVRMTPERLTWAALGGPASAEISLDGTQENLLEMVDYLGNGIDIHDERGWIWGGIIDEVEIKLKNLTLVWSLAPMRNKVKVIYNQVNAAGAVGNQADTGWYEDTDSSGHYGVRELVLELHNATAEVAAARAQTELVRRAWPQPRVRIEPVRNSGRVAAPSGKLKASGLFSTLDWVLYANSAGSEAYTETGEGLQAFGDAVARTRVAQSFQLASAVGWQAKTVRVRLRRNGAPADNVTVSLYSDSSGAPGSVLEAGATGSLSGSLVDEYLNWHEFTLGSRVSLSASTTYWLVIERSGSLDAEDCYAVDGDDGLGYSRGAFKIYNGSSWVDRSPNVDLLFEIAGVQGTSSQVQNLALSAGQFLSAVVLDVTSGVYSSPYRDGSRSALAEAIDLLESGTSNSRRMLAKVNEFRVLRIYEEPTASDDYAIDGDGNMLDRSQAPLPATRWPAGVWARLVDAPGSLWSDARGHIGRVFVDQVVFDGERSQVRLRDEGGLLSL